MSVRRLTFAGLLSMCVLALLLALPVVRAEAAVTHKLISQITEVPASSGAPLPGPITAPSAMTVDAGNLWVAEHVEGTSNFRVDEFDAATGAFIAQLPQQAPTLEYLDNGVAVGHATGETELYVGADAYPAGNPEGAVAVFGTNGERQGIWEGADTPAGNFSCFQCSGSGDVAVDNSTSLSDWAAGDVYVSSPEQRLVDVFKPEAHGKDKYVTQIVGTSPTEPFTSVDGIAIDEVNGDLLVNTGFAVDIFKPTILGEYEFAHQITGIPGRAFIDTGQGVGAIAAVGGEANGDIYLTTGESVVQFDSEGAYLGQFTPPSSSSFSLEGLAVDPVTGRVYVGEREVGVDVFSSSLVIPDSKTEAAVDVHAGAATLAGVVDPDGIQVEDCHFEYGTTTSYGRSVPCGQTPGEIGAGNGPVSVSADVSGLTPGTVYHFRLSSSNANGVNVGLERLVGPPSVDAEAASEVAQQAATIQAQVNPDGVETSYRFEYGTSTAYGTSVPLPPADIGKGEADVSLDAELAELQAGVTYHYRVVAANAAGTTTGADEQFTSVPPARIDAVTISNVLGSSASVHAEINPLGTDTEYRIEYGTTTSYGTSIPAPDADIGAGTSDVAITQQLTSLQPNTTYHVRLVAHNSLGVERSADHTFVYDESGGGLPENRAYEMVTPPQKNAALIGDVLFGPPPVIAGDGSRVILGSIQCFADAESCTAAREVVGSPYRFTRTPGGWRTTALAPPATRLETNTWLRYSADSEDALFSAPTPPTGEDDFYARRPDGSFVDIGPLTPPAEGANLAAVQEAFSNTLTATADLSHVVYAQKGSIWSFDAGEGQEVMEYSGTGNDAPTPVGVSGGAKSGDLISVCGTELAGFYNALSADGGTVYFAAQRCTSGSGVNAGREVPARELFARVHGGEANANTVAISEPAALSPQAPNLDCTTEACLENTNDVSRFRDAGFEGASADGSKVYFTDTQQLTDEANEDLNAADTAPACSSTSAEGGCNLYLYDFENPAGHNLIDVSTGAAGSGGPRVQGVMASSSDGSHVYFVAKGALTASPNTQGQTALAGADNLYVYTREAGQEGHVAFIAVLPEADSGEWSQGQGHANVTPNGRYLVFTSRGALTPDDTRTDGAQQVFRYDAQSGVTVRISIGEHGFDDNGNAGVGDARIVRSIAGYRQTAPGRPDPTMSDDGRRVFFMSPIALTPGALNSVHIGSEANGSPAYAQNVYEYDEGNVYLISDGRDTSAEPNELCESFSAVCLIGTDATGTNVFFSTVDQLLPQDTDTQLDVYDARICSADDPCLIAPSPSLPPCLGEACHGTPAAAPPVPSAPTATFDGRGSTPSGVGSGIKKKRKAARCAKGRKRRPGNCINAKRRKKTKRHKGGKR